MKTKGIKKSDHLSNGNYNSMIIESKKKIQSTSSSVNRSLMDGSHSSAYPRKDSNSTNNGIVFPKPGYNGSVQGNCLKTNNSEVANVNGVSPYHVTSYDCSK